MKKQAWSPAGNQCWACATVASIAYPQLAWAEILSKAKSCEHFVESFLQGKERLASRGVAACKPAIEENLSQDEDVSVSVNKFYIFKEQAVLEKQNSVRIPAEYLREVIDESGKSIKGVIVPNPEKPWRELVVSRTSLLSRSKAIGTGELRPNQNRELAQVLHKDHQVPGNLLHLVSASPSKGAGKGKLGGARGCGNGTGSKRKAENVAFAGGPAKASHLCSQCGDNVTKATSSR